MVSGAPLGPPGAPLAQDDLRIGWSELAQTITGFGGSDKWHPLFSEELADSLFDADKGVGLSILRVAIGPEGDYQGNWLNARKAAERGALVWATPWSPPGEWKDNGRTAKGGHLLPAHYREWAERLAGFAQKLKQRSGVSLAGISPQNEANYVAKWNSCVYSPAELVSFIKVLGPELAHLDPPPMMITPEAGSWPPLWGYTDAIAADPAAAKLVAVFSAHQYDGVSAPKSSLRPIWQTEYSTFDASDPSIANGLAVAKAVHEALVTANVSAWHYWWLMSLTEDNEGLLGPGGTKTKRLYTLGNYSKFVRPGFRRMALTGGPNGVLASAFRDCAGKLAVVAINTNASPTALGIVFDDVLPTRLTPWVTSATANLDRAADVDAQAGHFQVTLAEKSVTTLVGSVP